MDSLCDKAKQLRRNQTDAEKVLWQQLRAKQLGVKFRRQQSIPPYIVDFMCFEHKLVIELDGGQHATQQQYDAQRTRFLEQQGYRVVRFWNNDVFENKEGVLQHILMCIRAKTPHPSPLPQGERGYPRTACKRLLQEHTALEGTKKAPSPPFLKRDLGEGWGEG
jgi:very-short-patch-repair endonuclease